MTVVTTPAMDSQRAILPLVRAPSQSISAERSEQQETTTATNPEMKVDILGY